MALCYGMRKHNVKHMCLKYERIYLISEKGGQYKYRRLSSSRGVD